VESRQLALPSIATGVPLPGVITASGLLHGSATLVEASRRAREFADWLCALADAGYELEDPSWKTAGFTARAAQRPRTRVANAKAAGK
jgi:hypothetical protein